VHQRIIMRTRLLSDGRFSIAPAFVLTPFGAYFAGDTLLSLKCNNLEKT
jgi:hypothetical protein